MTGSAACARSPVVDQVRREGDDRLACRLRVPTDDDSLRGHFPGLAIVPGMMVVDWAAGLAARYFDVGPFVGMVSGKFRRPLRPGDVLDLTIEWQRGQGRLRYACHLGAIECARGTLEFGRDTA
ncbi:MAG: hypothetical protein U1F08_10905 [Steroidobacteraceae bacterium]